MPWPASLRPHLNGAHPAHRSPSPATGRTYVDHEVVLGDAAPEARIRLEDAHGHPLAVNKVGNLTRVFAETDDAVARRRSSGAPRGCSTTCASAAASRRSSTTAACSARSARAG